MPLYYFDITDGGPRRDAVGTECIDDEEMRGMTRKLLPEIALFESTAGKDRAFFTVFVRNNEGQAVHTATLSYAEMNLVKRPELPANLPDIE